MKKLMFIFLIAFTCIASCKKQDQAIMPETREDQSAESFTLAEAKSWSQNQDTSISRLNPNWLKAIKNNTDTKQTTWLIPIPGHPTLQKVKQGYRKLLIRKDTSGQISARILEIIPDAYVLQEMGQMEKGKFSGRLSVYTTDGKLEKGFLYASGKISGIIKESDLVINKLESLKASTTKSKQSFSIETQSSFMFESCAWYDSAYIDSDGIFTVRSEQLCTMTYYADGGSGGYSGGDYTSPADNGDYTGGGGDGGTKDPDPLPVPESSNLPGEEQQTVDPKKMMDCFKTLSSNPNASYQVKIHVQEPFPGTGFNIGPNSVGHVALELTVTSNGQSITQVVGYYPQGTKGSDRVSGPSRIVNNGDLPWDVSATFYVNQGNFQNMVNFISSPPEGYNFLTYNCTSFAYNAATLAGIDIPMGYTTVGLSGPSGATIAQTPAGMGAELRQMKANNPNANISTGGGSARESKGECK